MMERTTMTVKKSNPQIEPTADVGVMAEFSRLRATLSETHRQIPQLLQRQRDLERELGASESVELKAQLADTLAERQAAVRKRASAIAAVMELESALLAERGAVEQQRQAYAVRGGQRIRPAMAAGLQRFGRVARRGLWEEGRVLGETLKVQVPSALPTKAVLPLDGSVKAVRPLASEPVTAAVLPAHLSELGQQLDRLDAALNMCNSIRADAELETRHHRLATDRGTAAEFTGVFKVLAPFACMTDGLMFLPGDLIDSSLIGSGMLRRLQIGKRHIQPVAA